MPIDRSQHSEDPPSLARMEAASGPASRFGDTEAATIVTGASADGGDMYADWSSSPAYGGRYAVLEELGRGAMGRVLRAYDPKLQREVALKEVRGRLLGRDGPARLVIEARAMAKLSHPNVVGVYDVEEVTAGHVLLVMEYVPGHTLREWLAKGSPPWRSIVACFNAAGAGLAAAHAAGLLHRDFKPANVLVGRPAAGHGNDDADGPGLVKVTDFGLATARRGDAPPSQTRDGDGGSVTDTADPTHSGVVMGTPRYMAPEQHRAEPLSSSADQFAFCVALWEALTGAPPYAAQSDDDRAAVRDLALAKHRGPPSWPGAGKDPGVPPRLVAAIRRGLSADPQHRWPSMESLIEALQYDPARRRLAWLGVAGAALIFGLGGAAWGALATEDNRCSGAAQRLGDAWSDSRRNAVAEAMGRIEASYARDVWHRTSAALDAYAEAWKAGHRDACEATAIRGEQSSEVMDLRMACLHRAQTELDALSRLLVNADAEVVRNAHEMVSGLPPLSRCSDIDYLDADVPLPADHEMDLVEEMRAAIAASNAARRATRFDDAQAKLERAEALTADVMYGPVRTELALARGALHDSLGHDDEAEHAKREALFLATQWGQRDLMRGAARALLFHVGVVQRKHAEALRYKELVGALSLDEPRHEAWFRTTLGAVLRAQGKFREAETEHRRALSLWQVVEDPDDLEIATTYNNLATALVDQGRNAEAETMFRHVLELREQALGPEHPDVATARNNVAGALFKQGELSDAQTEIERALQLRLAAFGPDHPDVVSARNNLAGVLQAQGKLEQALDETRHVLEHRRRSLGEHHPEVGSVLSNMGNILQSMGEPEQAEQKHRMALRVYEKTLEPEHASVAMARHNLAAALHRQGKLEEAAREYRAALAARKGQLDDDHPSIAMTRTELALLLLEQGHRSEAHALATQAWTARQREDVAPADRAKAAFTLARAHPMTNRAERRRAIDLAREALGLYTEAASSQTDYDEQLRDVRHWIAQQGATP